MEQEELKHILNYSGVTVNECSEQFDELQKALRDIFLTPQNRVWFEKRYAEHKQRLSDFLIDSSACENVLYWELFTFGKLKALCNESATEVFEAMNIKECFITQIPNYNKESNKTPAYRLKGEYDVANVESAEEFELLKEIIKKESPIPYWVIDNISREIGKETYAFDKSMTWVLVLTHENEVFLYSAE